MENKSCVVICAARNIEQTFYKDLKRISESLSRFDEVSWIVIESDSDDNSSQLLSRVAIQSSNFQFVSLGPLSQRIPIRTERLAFVRNTGLQMLRDSENLENIDFVIVADLNGTNSAISKLGVDSCFTHLDWDACFANPLGPYYDVWALRHPVWSPNDCWEYLNFLRQHHRSPGKSLFAAVHSRMIKINPDSPWIPVLSAFGGFAIYRTTSILSAEYRGLTSDGKEICEHVPLNLELSEKGKRLFINPQMVNCQYNDHNINLAWSRRFIRWSKYPLKFVKGYVGSKNDKRISGARGLFG